MRLPAAGRDFGIEDKKAHFFFYSTFCNPHLALY